MTGGLPEILDKLLQTGANQRRRRSVVDSGAMRRSQKLGSEPARSALCPVARGHPHAGAVYLIWGHRASAPKIGTMQKSTHTPQYARLRRRLSELRVSASLSQRQLAAALRVPHTWVAKVEAGERRIDLIEFAWFCAACGRSPADEAHRLLNELFDSAIRRARTPATSAGRRRQ